MNQQFAPTDATIGGGGKALPRSHPSPLYSLKHSSNSRRPGSVEITARAASRMSPALPSFLSQGRDQFHIAENRDSVSRRDLRDVCGKEVSVVGAKRVGIASDRREQNVIIAWIRSDQRGIETGTQLVVFVWIAPCCLGPTFVAKRMRQAKAFRHIRLPPLRAIGPVSGHACPDLFQFLFAHHPVHQRHPVAGTLQGPIAQDRLQRLATLMPRPEAAPTPILGARTTCAVSAFRST